MAGQSSVEGVARPLERVFISYRRNDTGRAAQRLAAALERVVGKAGVFVDQRALLAGDRWRERLRAEVIGSDVVIVLIGRSWLSSASTNEGCRGRLRLKARPSERGRRRLDEPEDMVRRELEWAIEAGRRIVPVLVDGAILPSADSLPESVRELTEHEYRELHTVQQRDFENDVEKLLYELGVHPGLIHAARSPLGVSRRSRGTHLALVIATLGATGLSFALVAWPRPSNVPPPIEVQSDPVRWLPNRPPPTDATRSIDVRLKGESGSSSCGLPGGARIQVVPLVAGTTGVASSSPVVECAARLTTSGGSERVVQRLRLENAPGFMLDPDVVETSDSDHQVIVRVKPPPKLIVQASPSRVPSAHQVMAQDLSIKLTCSGVAWCVASGAALKIRRSGGVAAQARVDGTCTAHFGDVMMPKDEQVSLELVPRDATRPFNCRLPLKLESWDRVRTNPTAPIQNCFCQGPDPQLTDFDCSSPCQ